MHRGWQIRLLLLLSLVMAGIGAALVAVESELKLQKSDREFMRIGLDDVVRRVSETQVNLDEITNLYADDALAKCRAFRLMINRDPSLLNDQSRLEEMARTLDVDELHVSDEKGVLIACVPKEYLGCDMSATEQTRPFMVAITNREFELVQQPMERGYPLRKSIESRLFQYVGIARYDRPGIVQIGYRPSRLDVAKHIADIPFIAKTSRIGSDGRVKIRPRAENETQLGRRRVFSSGIQGEDGISYSRLSTDVGMWRVSVDMPQRNSLLLSKTFRLSLIVTLGVLLVLSIGLVILVIREGLVVCWRELVPDSRLSNRRHAVLSNPIVISLVVLFVASVTVTWGVVTWNQESYSRKLLANAGEEFKLDFRSAIDNVLFYLGSIIVNKYPTPYSFQPKDIEAILRNYALDEINVVNGDGIVTASSIGVEGDNQWLKSSPREFNELILSNGVSTFAQDFRESFSEKGVFRKYAAIAFPKESGYIQLGFDESRIQNEIDYRLSELAESWSIGDNGYFLLAKNSGEILSCGYSAVDAKMRADGLTLDGVGFDVSALKTPNEPEFGTETIFGQRVRFYTLPLGRYHRAIVCCPESDFAADRFFISALVGSILFIILVVVGVFSSRLQQVVSQLRGYIARESEQRAKDLSLAKTIQTSSLPLALPAERGFEIQARMDTAKEVGGDFYDFYMLPSGKELFLVADVSGKGIPAAMFMMKAKAIIKASCWENDDLSAAIQDANNRLCEGNAGEMFVTAWVGVYDTETGHIDYVSAGHNPPLIKRADGTIEWLRGHPSLVFGAMEGVPYRVHTTELRPGDMLFLYTDGVTEAQNRSGELFGEERLEKHIAACSTNYLESVAAAIRSFAQGESQSDDITMLIFSRIYDIISS